MDNSKNEVPYANANFVSKLFFCWMTPFMRLGYSKKLDKSDLYKIHAEDSSQNNFEKIDQLLQNSKNSKKPNGLRGILIKEFLKSSLLYGFLILVQECIIKITQSIVLGLLLRSFIENPADDFEFYRRIIYASVIICTSIISNFIHHQYFFGVCRLGMQMRISCCSLIFKKALKLSHRSLGGGQKSGGTTIGQISNLLSNDVVRFDVATTLFHYLWIGPIQCAIVTYILWNYFGVYCLSGILILLLFVPFQGFMGKLFSQLRLKTAKNTDSRMKLLEEVLNGINCIKYYSLEAPFIEDISKIRSEEMKIIFKNSYLKGLNMTLYFISSKFFIFITLILFVLDGNTLNPENIFVTFSLYNFLRLTMSQIYPLAISQISEALVSIQRIDSFLNLEEHSEKTEKFIEREENGFAIKIENFSAAWEENEEILKNINLFVEKGELVSIIGSIGSGKTSMLQSILKELGGSKGNLDVFGSVSYISQEPWLFNGTIKENIIFGQKFEKDWYDQVIQACALDNDFSKLTYGDNTFVGEKGCCLSGGQKARINLARGVYSNCDIYLLDDPLSAVDLKIVNFLYQKCICGILKDKTRIFVTHQNYLLSENDLVYQMKNGHLNKVKIDNLETDSKIKDSEKPLEINEEIPKIQKENEENSSDGNVKLSCYINYLRSGGNFFILSSFLLFSFASQLIFTFSDYFLNLWTKKSEIGSELGYFFNTLLENDSLSYFLIILLLLLTCLIRSLLFFKISSNASESLHKKMIEAVLGTSINFFEENPAGSIFNRFSKDLGQIDDILPSRFLDVFSIFLNIVGTIILIILLNIYLLIPVAILCVLFCYIRHYFMKTSGNLKRLESTTRSPLFSHMSDTLSGLSTIRAAKAEKSIIEKFDQIQDIHTSAWFLFLASNRWFGVMLDIISIVLLSSVTFGFLFSQSSSGVIGLAISSILSFSGIFQWWARETVEVENLMVSVERIFQYITLEPEKISKSENTNPKKENEIETWLKNGEIEFRNVNHFYGINKDNLALNRLNFTIRPSEKIGIIGRTGSGKSTLLKLLFRLQNPSKGCINIDGDNISQVSLKKLRTNLSIIPQEPFLFNGTLRKNLDPNEKYTDSEIWKTLEITLLDKKFKNSEAGLDFEIFPGGRNLSVGERQLICLGRVILRKNKIIVFDEATASLDLETDGIIQKIMRDEFIDSTILTIAHRLNTVMDSDRILVLERGNIMEFDEPHKLLKNESSLLYKFAAETGSENFEELLKSSLEQDTKF